MVSKKTLFDDPSAEISALINVVKTELNSLKKETENLTILKNSTKTSSPHEQIHRDTILLVLNTLLADSTKLFSNCLAQRSQVLLIYNNSKCRLPKSK